MKCKYLGRIVGREQGLCPADPQATPVDFHFRGEHPGSLVFCRARVFPYPPGFQHGKCEPGALWGAASLLQHGPEGVGRKGTDLFI